MIDHGKIECIIVDWFMGGPIADKNKNIWYS